MPSNSSKPNSNSKSPSSPAAKSSAELNDYTQSILFPLLWGTFGVIVQSLLCYRGHAGTMWLAIPALASTVLLIFGGITLQHAKALSRSSGNESQSRRSREPYINKTTGQVSLFVGAFVGLLAGVYFAFWTIGAALLIFVTCSISNRLVILRDFLIAILAGALFLGTATAFGKIAWGGYPAAFAFFFFLAWRTVLGIETWEADVKSQRRTLPALFGPGVALAVAGILFFIFGVITTWPFLNDLYRTSYFWIVAIGVDLPLLWMWGRLRNKDRTFSAPALARFNRWTKWLIFIFLIALLFA